MRATTETVISRFSLVYKTHAFITNCSSKRCIEIEHVSVEEEILSKENSQDEMFS